MAETPRWKLPLIAASQAQKHVTHNEAILMIDLLAGVIPAKSRSANSPPGGTADGDVYILGSSGTGTWTGFDAGDIAMRVDGSWRRVIPSGGMIASVADEGGMMIYFVTSWQDVVWPGAPGLIINHVGVFAGLSAFDGEDEGFVYASVDGDGDAIETAVLFIKNSNASGDWSDALPFEGRPGTNGTNAEPVVDYSAFILNDATPVAPGVYPVSRHTPYAGTIPRVFAEVTHGAGSVNVAVMVNSVTVAGPVTITAGDPWDAAINLPVALGDNLDFIITDVSGVRGVWVQLGGKIEE